MIYPIQIKTRRKIDALTGIKSSLDQIRSVIALAYLFYVASGRKASVKYSVAEGNRTIIAPHLLEAIEKILGKSGINTIINSNPLITNQYEPLYVGVTLLMKLGYLKMEGKQSTAERTGGNRYPKQLYFAQNILTLDLILEGFSENIRITSLYEWLQNKKASNHEFEERVCTFLSTCTIFTQFKLRDSTNSELFFQTEGIYKALMQADRDVLFLDNHEFVGPTRIYNNVLKEGLEPWVDINKGVLYLTSKDNPNAETMCNIISTTLDIYNVKDDAIEIGDSDIEKQEDNQGGSVNKDYPLQQIFYGAPGTGKSNTIKKVVDEQGKRCHRTTFHPDSDYSTFVGAYKPTMKESYITKDGVTTKEEKIIYMFCPQAFTNAYVEAWNTEEDVYLVIEEINRGNCAQIFGDLFQLLDRKNGISEYPVEADADLQNYINKALAKTTRTDIPDDVKSGEKMMLPSNLYIWATMNTSDQSLFPIDSAFKRRWEWKYIKIKEGRDENGNKLDWKVDVKMDEAGTLLPWWDFIQKINEIIASMTSSADKQLGYFFCCAKDSVIDEETFVSKVIFYLWNDVFKDYGFEDASLFRYTDDDGKEKDLTFPDFYDEDGEKVNTERLTDFVKKVMNWKKTSEENS